MTLALTDKHAQLGKISNNLERHGDDDLVTGFTLPLKMRIPRPQLVELMSYAFDACVWQINGEPMEWTRRVLPITLAGEVYVNAKTELVFDTLTEKSLTFEDCRVIHVEIEGFDSGGYTRVGCHLYVRPGIGEENLLLQEYQGREIAVQVSSGKLRVKGDKAQRDLPLQEPKTERQAAYERGDQVAILTTTIDGIMTHEHPSFSGGKVSHPQAMACLVCRGEAPIGTPEEERKKAHEREREIAQRLEAEHEVDA